jgi:hypothetical protein
MKPLSAIKRDPGGYVYADDAIEATVAGNGPRELALTSKRHGANDIVIAVHDFWTGISILNQIWISCFEPFFTNKGLLLEWSRIAPKNRLVPTEL